MFSQKTMDRCIEHARKNPIQSRGRTSISRMAALIISENWLEFQGVNSYKTHPLVKRFSKDDTKICLHAEMDALVKYFRYDPGWTGPLSHYDIYIARVLKDGTPALAKPCETCLGALTYFGIRNIYWTGQ